MADKLEQVAIRLVEQPPLYSEEYMDNPEAAIRVMQDFLAPMERELLCVVNLQKDLRPINMNIVSMGALDHTVMHPREIFKSAILSNAASMLVIHNHPSGSLAPSQADIDATARIQQAGEIVGIPLLDHIIVSREKGYYSMKDTGILSLIEKGEKVNADAVRQEHATYRTEKEEHKTIPLPVAGKDMKSIMESLEEGVKDVFTSERYAEYLKTMSKFHNYSFQNTLLIAMQRPDATFVAGYRNWQSMGRQVRKGEKGITIIAPAPIKRKEQQAVLDQNQHPILDKDGKPKMEEVEVVIPRFKTATVFDIEQTDGKPIETLAPEELSEAVHDYELFLKVLKEISPVPIRMDEIEGGAKGYYSLVTKEIVIQQGMGESQTIKTAVHEISHAVLHDRDTMKEKGEEKDRMTKEVEAESVAYCVCSAFHIDTSDYSFPYIAGWSSDREMKELKDSMDVIRKTAGNLIDALSEKLQAIHFEKEQKMEQEGDEISLFHEIGDQLEKTEENHQYIKDSLKEMGLSMKKPAEKTKNPLRI